MFDFSVPVSKKVKKASSYILNSKVTYILLILIMLIQFILVSIIFFSLSNSSDRLNEKLNFIESRNAQIDSKLNYVNSSLMGLQAQIYRGQNNK